ncbi:MAG: hypothetical protein EAZ44_10545 [Cytophagia bacterium]|nr:MAG: hypothetical protein EAZ44_10545 [Cytophagia bacterium]
MIYPLIEDYKDSFRNPENYFDTLKPLYPVQAPWDNKQPYFASGGFATVFKLKDKNQKYWAFKCFTQEVKDRKERLQAIATHLQQLKSPYFVDFKYMEKELWVCSEKAGDKEQPIVVMEWIEGKILGKFIEEKVKENDRKALFQTLQKFVQMSEYLLQNGIAHGDLKHDNIFVKQNGDLVLIDYDGMFVPALWDKPMIEAGSPSYQHPQRPQAPFNNQLDHFSMLVIVIDLYALYLNPALRNALKDSDSLLIQQNDLQNPAQSPLFAQLNQLKDTFLNQMLLELKRSLANQQIYVVGFGNIIKEVRRIEYFPPVSETIILTNEDEKSIMVTQLLSEIISLKETNLVSAIITLYKELCTTETTSSEIANRNSKELERYFKSNKFINFISLPIRIQKVFANKNTNKVDGKIFDPKWINEQDTKDLYDELLKNQRKLKNDDTFEFHFEKKEYSQRCELENHVKTFFELDATFVINNKISCLMCKIDEYYFCKNDIERIRACLNIILGYII